jgi:hypothetical protein
MVNRPGGRGEPGTRGARGPQGLKGATGSRGPRGRRGAAGPSTSPADILAVVEDQFSQITKQLSEQLTRTGQVQVELDRHARELQEVHAQLREVQKIVKRFLASG